MNLLPERLDAALDADMRWLWEQAPEWPADVRLYGGTACALYFGHRSSMDFDFVHVDWGVTEEFVRARMGVFGQGRLEGGPGRIDLACSGPNRIVRVNYMETDPSLVLAPKHPPVTAANGMLIAHPNDLMAAKLRALANRDLACDYQDAAAAVRAAPEAVLAGIAILEEAQDDVYRLLRLMSAPGPDAEAECPQADLDAVDRFAVEFLLAHARRAQPAAQPALEAGVT